VLRNRTKLQEKLALVRPVYLNQVHGTELVELVQDSPNDLAADGAYTRECGVACSIMVADCLPVLCDTWQDGGGRARVARPGRRWWCGCFGGNTSEIYARSPRTTNDSAIEVIAWLGPVLAPVLLVGRMWCRLSFQIAQMQSIFCLKPREVSGKSEGWRARS
jgi:hypothetical protein